MVELVGRARRRGGGGRWGWLGLEGRGGDEDGCVIRNAFKIVGNVTEAVRA